jgi:2-oxoglutarate ferredoxin oxidoreductase subunit alpha
MGLAISLELPLLIIDIQRGGPSTGLPTKTEQADLLHALYGRHGEAPLPVLAPKTPSDCFAIAIEATRLAVKYRTPVIVLSDGYLANGAEPWRLPDLDSFAPIDPAFASEPNHTDADGNEDFWPYIRDPETLARPWAPPGIPGLEHRIGGLEKEDGSGNVSYTGANHERMVRLRAAKVAGIAADIPLTEIDREDGAEVVVVGWGSTFGAIAAGVQRVRARGHKVAQVHLIHLNPFPSDLGEVLSRYRKVLVPEVNLGQLSRLLRAEYLIDAVSFTQIQGVPFRAAAMEAAILHQIEDLADVQAATPGGNGTDAAAGDSGGSNAGASNGRTRS